MVTSHCRDVVETKVARVGAGGWGWAASAPSAAGGAGAGAGGRGGPEGAAAAVAPGPRPPWPGSRPPHPSARRLVDGRLSPAHGTRARRAGRAAPRAAWAGRVTSVALGVGAA